MVAVALAPGTAGGQGHGPPDLGVALDPATARSPSRLLLAADGSGVGIAGRIPRSVVLGIQRGFKIDRDAVAQLCTPAQAGSSTCPEASRIGRGIATVTAATAFGPIDVAAVIDAFLAVPTGAGDLAGVVVTVDAAGSRRSSAGRIARVATGPFGYQVRFDALDENVQPPPGVTVSLKRLEMTLGASRVEKRKVVRRKRVRYRDRRGRLRTRIVRRRVVRKVRHSFITNPTTCAGSWTAHGTVGFADGSTIERDLSVPCRRR